MPEIVHRELSYRVRGVLLDVHNCLGPMLPERFYQDAVALGLEEQDIRCETEKTFEVYYRDVRVGLYRVDVWIEGGKLLLELKVAPEVLPVHKAQALSYLKVTDADLAIVVNFGAASLQDTRLPNFLRGRRPDPEWTAHPLADDLLYPELTGRLLEALHHVHAVLGPGFLHRLYRRAVMVELASRDLNHEYIREIPVYYHDHCLGMQPARLILVEGKVLLAAVAVRELDAALRAQLKARLRHLRLQLGLLANFANAALQVEAVRV
ncbi:MAG: GxxExxY protein [Anaerolineae bacterium]|nr:GxxExxY protein [Anaerolineae bacterium]